MIYNLLQAGCISKSYSSRMGHPTLCSDRECWAGMAWSGLQRLNAPLVYLEGYNTCLAGRVYWRSLCSVTFSIIPMYIAMPTCVAI